MIQNNLMIYMCKLLLVAVIASLAKLVSTVRGKIYHFHTFLRKRT